MRTTLEKVLILKSTKIFGEIAESELAELARIMQIVTLEAESEVIHEGEIGESMYIIAEGAVGVYKNEKLIAMLGEREVFGELAVLDPEPRSASVVTKSESVLYEISKEALYDLMLDSPLVVQGIIKVLCQRLRDKSI